MLLLPRHVPPWPRRVILRSTCNLLADRAAVEGHGGLSLGVGRSSGPDPCRMQGSGPIPLQDLDLEQHAIYQKYSGSASEVCTTG